MSSIDAKDNHCGADDENKAYSICDVSAAVDTWKVVIEVVVVRREVDSSKVTFDFQQSRSEKPQQHQRIA